jgi:hypothetical protein
MRGLAILMIILGLLDYGLTCRGAVAEWYGNLRLILSAIAGLCLIVAGWFV